MQNQIWSAALFLIGFSLLLVCTELVYRKLNLKGEITRKFAHFTATLSTVAFPFLFNDHFYVLALAVIFFILLYASRNSNLLGSIHNIDRISAGSYLLPVSIYLTFLVSNILEDKFLFILPITVLAFSDPLAGIIGMSFKPKENEIRIFGTNLGKTWIGSLSFLASSFIICIIILYIKQLSFDLQLLYIALPASLSGTLAELISRKGTDNLFIPLTILMVLVILT